MEFVMKVHFIKLLLCLLVVFCEIHITQEVSDIFSLSLAKAETVNGKKKRSNKKGSNGVRAPKRTTSKGTGKSVSSAPIYGAFIQAFKSCEPGCTPVNVGTWGSRGNKSCHPQGRAVDVGGVQCSSGKHMAPGARFEKYVRCMERKGWKALFKYCVKGAPKNNTTCHRDHAHFSKGCTVKGKRTW
jgi:hypothetical protein